MKITVVGSLSLLFLLVGSVVRADTILPERQKIIATSPGFAPQLPFGIALGGFPKAVNIEETGPFVNLAAGDEIFLSKNDPVAKDIIEFLLDPVQERFGNHEGDFDLFDLGNLFFATGTFESENLNLTLVGNSHNYPRPDTRVDGIFIKVISDRGSPSGDVRAQFGFFGENVPELGTGPSLLVAAGLLALAGWRRREKGVT
jgi:hypothetical protein